MWEEERKASDRPLVTFTVPLFQRLGGSYPRSVYEVALHGQGPQGPDQFLSSCSAPSEAGPAGIRGCWRETCLTKGWWPSPRLLENTAHMWGCRCCEEHPRVTQGSMTSDLSWDGPRSESG